MAPRADVLHSRLTVNEIERFLGGTHHRLYETLGAHIGAHEGRVGTWFAVWAPNASAVHVIGDFNQWANGEHPMCKDEVTGIWHTFIANLGKGTRYKYSIQDRSGGWRQKADPLGAYHEAPPGNASIVWSSAHTWADSSWMGIRGEKQTAEAPVSIYEVHLGSWARVPQEGRRMLTYRELAPRLADWCRRQGYTHLQLMPVMEHPFGGSWGYQITGYFAPTHRFGDPDDFAWMVDYFHQHDLGVILDWSAAQFPNDEHGLAEFDGTHLYEPSDPRRGVRPDMHSCMFDLARNEVRSFLLSSALFWLERYHADGIRLDGLASILYHDYGRREGEWIPNEAGGRENREGISFLKQLNETVSRELPGARTIAEEPTAWPMVSHPTFVGGLGFGFKWDVGWMHDTLRHFERDPLYRRWHHNEITFRGLYAFTENFVLPLSHDEVVPGKGSLLNKMPGDRWKKFAGVRLLFGYQFAQPGKKLIFMGSDFAQWREWSHDESLDWHLADEPPHAGLRKLVADLNGLYRSEPALHELDCNPKGFEWVVATDAEQGILAFLRRGKAGRAPLLCAFNLTPVPRYSYAMGTPIAGRWEEIMNTDSTVYGGSGVGNLGGVDTQDVASHQHPQRLELTLPPLACVILRGPSK